MNLSSGGWKLTQPVAAGEVVRWTDVAVDEANSVVRLRREMEQTCRAARYGLDLTAWKRGRVWNIDHLGRPTCRSRP